MLRVPVMQDRRPGRCGLPDVAGDLRIQFAETGQDGQAAQTQNARSQPQSNRAHLSQAPPLVLLKQRTARRGAHAGQLFWGCSTFPACRATRTLDSEAVRAR